MKKCGLLFLVLIFLGIQLDAQVIDVATKDGYIQNTSTNLEKFLETTAIEVKTPPVTWSRVGFVELPVNELVAANSVDFNIYFYNANTAGDINVIFDIMEGPLPANISWANQPAEESFSNLANVTVNNANYRWVTIDVTSFYNTAVANGSDFISIRITGGTDNPLVKFYSSRSSTGDIPHLEISSACERQEVDVDTILCAGSFLQVGDEQVSEDGVYRDTLTTYCGADSVITYHAMFIQDGTQTNDVSICNGDAHIVQTGPRSQSEYTTAGSYTDVIETDGCTKTIVTNLTVNELPVPQDLGDDVSFREEGSVTLDAGAGFAGYQWYNDDKAIDEGIAQTIDVSLANEAFHLGTNEIMVEVTDANGCVGTDDIWVEIIGNLLSVEKDCFLEEAGDRLLDITRLEVKYDLYGDQATPEGEGPFYTKETYLAFDISGDNLPENITNVRLRMYLYGITLAPNVTDPVEVQIDCEYMDGLYSDAMIFSTRPAAGDRNTLALAQTVEDDSVFVEWDINEIFMNDIYGSLNQFTVILSSYTDATSTLAKFKDVTTGIIEWRPALVYEIEDVSGINEVSGQEISVYPNPATDMIYIRGNQQFKRYLLFNIMGEQILKGELSDNAVNVSSLVSGSYILRLENGRESLGRMITIK
ncbi:MAG: DNRLRE domain-containing protein [Bacteroidales bacterium]|nr:DNRLRE domain-containing protein [Bacteroidales bacterium]MDT8430713.1 DNRLRE domain-containing protein [Bacteroidales bacterium]